MIKKIFNCAILVIFPLFSLFAVELGKVNNIKIQGNELIEKNTVLAYIDFAEGDTLSDELMSSSIKKLYSTGWFSDVTINYENKIAVIILVESPIIQEVVFEGNKKFEDDKLQEIIQLKPGIVFSKQKLQNDIQNILSVYRSVGKFSAQVTPKVINRGDKKIALIYEIKEGPKSVISKINFVGNDSYSASTLKDVLISKESKFFRFGSKDKYEPEKMELDEKSLSEFYSSNGFADFEMVSSVAEFIPETKNFILNFSFIEGKKYKFGEIEIATNLQIDTEEIKKKMPIGKGEIFNGPAVREFSDKISTICGDYGYTFVRIMPMFKRNNDIIDVTFKIEEATKAYVNKIEIIGNVRTLDKVIRREFRLSEGDAFNNAKISRSRERIMNLGFFKKVDLDMIKKSDDLIDIELEVEEKPTGFANFTVGYSTLNGPIAGINYNEANFLGTGRSTDIQLETSSRVTGITWSFNDPYFMEKDIGVNFDVFHNKVDNARESSYKMEQTGSGLEFSYPLAEHLNHSIRYSIKRDKITDVNSNASILLADQKGDHITSFVGHSFLYDKRNNRVNPVRGYYFKLSQDFTVGGTEDFMKNELRGAYYLPIFEDDIILKLSAKLGKIHTYDDDPMFINNLFFLGGNNLRGFRVSGVGPRDITSEKKDAIGGKTYYVGTAEVNFPLGFPKEIGVKGALFYDAGSLYDTSVSSQYNDIVWEQKSVRQSVGFGMDWDSPLGKIRIYYALPVSTEEFDREKRFNFTIGGLF